MDAPLNCWEFKHCGREAGGIRSAESGICPASTCTKADRINYGRNGGRICWAITGTLCRGKPERDQNGKWAGCIGCDFYRLVQSEEGGACVQLADALELIGAGTRASS